MNFLKHKIAEFLVSWHGSLFVFIGYPLSVLQSLCPSDPELDVLSNDVPDVLVTVCSSISKGMIDKVLRLTPEVDLRAMRLMANR